MSKHRRKHTNRQKPQMYGNNGKMIITEDYSDSNVIEIAHMLLDDYIIRASMPASALSHIERLQTMQP